MTNKSRTYILPLVSDATEIPFVEFCNTYLHTKDDMSDNMLHVVYDNYETIKNFNKTEELLLNNQYYENHFIDGETLVVSFRLDSVYYNDYELFKAGKYSRMSDKAKKAIMKFWVRKYGKTDRKFIIDIKNILDRSPVLRRELEQQLGVKIDPEMDLSSSIYIEREIYGS